MKAIRYTEFGGPEVLELVEVEEPVPPADGIRIVVRAAGVNGIDWKIRQGGMMKVSFPAGTGIDAAGIVEELGEDVTGVAVGDAVFGSGRGTLAEKAVLTEWAVKPEALSFEEAAGYPIAVETAVRILDDVNARGGQTVLVSGASGGVGSAVIQFARERGLTVIGTASAANQDYLRALGAEATPYGDGLVERVRSLAPQGIDAALDISGAGVIPELIELTGDPERVVTIADFGAGDLGARVSSQSRDKPAALREAARLFSEGRFHLDVQATFPLAEAAEAQAKSAEGHAAGRIVVTVP